MTLDTAITPSDNFDCHELQVRLIEPFMKLLFL